MADGSRCVTLVALCAALQACATTLPKEGADADLGAAAAQPLQDLSIQKIEIPAPLKAAVADPYKPAPNDCPALTAEVAALEGVLGPDLDRPLEREEFDDQVMKMLEGAVRDLAVGWIPFRSGVRKLTGAEGRLRKAQAAIRAGNIRRAYLKGAGERMGCAEPGRPLRAVPPAAAEPPKPR